MNLKLKQFLKDIKLGALMLLIWAASTVLMTGLFWVTFR